MDRLDFRNKSTEQLITTFQSNTSSEAHSKEAFIVLCSRFRKDLLTKCEIICSNYGHPVSVAEQIADTTFKNYAKRKSFKFEAMTSKSVDTAFKLFLYKIARNALIDFYRIEKRKKEGKHYDGSETIVTKLPDIDESKLSFNEKFKFQAIDQLPQKEKTVYLTYMTHEKDGVNLPPELRQSLKEYLGTNSQSTVRWYKKNATDKVDISMKALIATQTRQNNE